MMDMIREDIGLMDVTTVGLGIGHLDAKITFAPKRPVVLCGAEIVETMCKEMHLSVKRFCKSGDFVEANTLILEAYGSAAQVHQVWKVCQNILEYLCGIATKTSEMLTQARLYNPHIELLTTRKIFPRTKELALQAVYAGGGAHHRLGLYDSILVFKQHRVFFDDKASFEAQFRKMKQQFLEKKIVVEVENADEALYFARLGADILQCEKMTPEEFSACVASVRREVPSVFFSATGGVNEKNIGEYAQAGADCIVTSSPYHAKPADIRVIIEKC
ncbi:ModD protein [Sulfurospirillum cavolei]|uniref:ModD protein n=1 Tax=Sulfurospirillum cavolei TaxID=366522 RepID=UPI0007649430|nr:ModD protein [Sulfurospirillum cavolei]